MKKLFTLLVLLTCFMGAKAATKTVVDYECDYTKATSWSHGWINEEEHLVFEPGVGLHFQSTEAQEQFYSFQYQLHPGISPLDNDALYTITLRIKGSVAQDIHASFSGSSTPGMIPITTDWVDVVLENCVNDPEAAYFANSGCLLIQPGDYVGEFWIESIKITHEEQENAVPITWLPVEVTNGDAESAWPDWALTEEGGINANWRGDRTGEICAWALTMGRNFDDQCPASIADASFRARPFPADIEVDPADATNHVFAVHVTQIDKIDDDNSVAWSNQFWFQSPKTYKAGTKVKVKFRYKAEKAAPGVASQMHRINPSIYLNGNGVGTLAFTTDWQDCEKDITWDNEGWSIAFNLTNEFREPNVYYFDDISFSTMKLDEGWFVASANTETGIEYDFANATEFVVDPDDETQVIATVGTEGKQDTWVNEVMISTVRGENSAFKGATIKPTGTIKAKEEDNWQDFAAGSSAKIKLPAAGVWKITIAPADNQILFYQIEGEAEKEPVDIVTNTTEFVINATERDWRGKDNDGNLIEEQEGAGQPWDNQFWIAANRNLAKDEVTVLKFKYKSSIDAKVSTQAHKVGDDGKPCTYLNWQGIPEMSEFKAGDWQEYAQEFTIPAGDDGMRSIVFNLAEIKSACDYYIKDVQWYLKYDEEGKTLENLISGEGTENFWIKINGVNKNAPYQYGTDPTDGISNVVNKVNTGSAVIYNLAGQRVSKDYKGIVVKNGKKVVVK